MSTIGPEVVSESLTTVLAPTTLAGNPNPGYFLHMSGRIPNSGVYFVGAYLPTVLAILFGLPWIVINHNARSMEPFCQLSRVKGASAEHMLITDFHAPLAPLHFLLRSQ